MAIDPRRTRHGVAARHTDSSKVLAAVIVALFAQQARAQLVVDPLGAYGTPWRVSAAASVQETWSDNINLSSDNSRRSDFVTDFSPQFSVTRTGRRLNLILNYSPDFIYYARGSNGAQFRNNLNASSNAVLLDDLLFFDASANISQANISPYGTQAANTVNGSNNRAEYRSYSFGPTLRSRVGQDFSYSLGYNYALSSSDSSAFASNHSSHLFGGFQTSTSFRDVGYGMNYDRTEQDAGGPNVIVTERISGTLTYVLQPTIHLHASGGYDRDRYPATNQPELKGLAYSGGFDWQPSRHTSLNVDVGHRYFGPTANIRLSESLPHVSVVGSYTRDQTTSSGGGVSALPDPNYQLLDQFYRATITDPALRAQAVTTALQQAGLPTSQFSTSQFLSNQLFVQKRAELSVALLGLQNTVTFDVSRTESQALSNLSVGFDIFNQSSRFRSTAYSANWSYRPGPRTSFNATVQKSDSRALEGTGSTSQRTLVASVNRQISRKVTGTVFYRNVTQKGTGDNGGFYSGNYHENAVVGSLRVTF